MDEKEIALAQIRKTVTENPVVLYMKGTPQFPQCGFSGRAAQVLKACGVTNYVAVNVLEDAGAWNYLKDRQIRNSINWAYPLPKNVYSNAYQGILPCIPTTDY